MHINEFNFYEGDKNQFIDTILGDIGKNKKKVVITPNLDFWMRASRELEFRQVVELADYKVCDGMPLIWTLSIRSWIYKESRISKITGSDLLPSIMERLKNTDIRIAFIGGEPGSVESARDIMSKKFDLDIMKIHCYCPPYGFERDTVQNSKLLEFLASSKPNLVFVGLGSPKQEYWIFNNIGEIDFDVALGVGASFDFISGNKVRAPSCFQKVGFEWLWRLCQEPSRLGRRYYNNALAFVPLFISSMKKR